MPEIACPELLDVVDVTDVPEVFDVGLDVLVLDVALEVVLDDVLEVVWPPWNEGTLADKPVNHTVQNVFVRLEPPQSSRS